MHLIFISSCKTNAFHTETLTQKEKERKSEGEQEKIVNIYAEKRTNFPLHRKKYEGSR